MPETAIDPQWEQHASKAEIARANGALSNGPISAEGKARSALNATRHGLCARTMVLGEAEDGGELAALRAALLGRWQPVDAAEAHLVEELVFAAWRQVRLRAVEDAVLARAERGEAPSPALPSLATLLRYRGRIERDGRQAVEQLAALRRGRKDLADPMRLRWLAERLEQAQAIAAACAPATGESSMIEPDTDDSDIGTNEPTDQDCTNELPPGMNEPRYDVAPLAVARAEGVSAPRLNRHERRRLAALGRRELPTAA